MRTARSAFILLAILVGACRTTDGSETKQETDDRLVEATRQLVDVSPRINLWLNEAIDAARLEVNPDGLPWDEQRKLALIESAGKRLAKIHPGSGIGIHWGNVNLEVSGVTEIEARIAASLSAERNEIHYTKFRDSRYGDNPIGPTRAKFMAHVMTATADHSISPAIRLGEHIVGVDKLGHFAEEGLWYFLAEQQGLVQGEAERWQFGQFMEGDPELPRQLHAKYRKAFGAFCRTCVIFGGFGYYGMASTGVCSYADMKANESGYQMFASLYADPAGYRFDLSQFDVASWNEEATRNKYAPSLIIRQ